MNKPIVHYTWLGFCQVGWRAEVYAVDHPRLPHGKWFTSIVLNIALPEFETLNSIYKPFEAVDRAAKETKSVQHT